MLSAEYLTAIVYVRCSDYCVTIVNCAINRTRKVSFPVLAELILASRSTDCAQLASILYREFNDTALLATQHIELIVLGDEPEN